VTPSMLLPGGTAEIPISCLACETLLQQRQRSAQLVLQQEWDRHFSSEKQKMVLFMWNVQCGLK